MLQQFPNETLETDSMLQIEKAPKTSQNKETTGAHIDTPSANSSKRQYNIGSS